MKNKPYISVVIVGRNDGYGEDFVGRLNTFVRSLDHQVAQFPHTFELIIVEWNPADGYAPLSDVVDPTQNLPVRVIRVPQALHDSIGSAHPVLEFHGKNVGIRRAQGEFVLITNPDIIFSDDLIKDLARKKLRIDTVYRTDRYDFNTAGINDVASGDLVDFAVKNTFVVHAMAGSASVSEPVHETERTLELLPRSGIDDGVWHTNGAGDFMLAAKETFFTVRGLYETTQHRWHVDSISLMRFDHAKIKQHVYVSPCCIFHQHHVRRAEDVAFASLDIGALAKQPGHTDWGLKTQDLDEVVIGGTL